VPGGVRRGSIAGTSNDPGDQILVVELLKVSRPTTGSPSRRNLTIDKLPGKFRGRNTARIEVKRETGYVALSGSDELGLTVDPGSGLQKVDAAEFFKSRSQKNLSPAPISSSSRSSRSACASSHYCLRSRRSSGTGCASA